jgi:hypothetical protein
MGKKDVKFQSKQALSHYSWSKTNKKCDGCHYKRTLNDYVKGEAINSPKKLEYYATSEYYADLKQLYLECVEINSTLYPRVCSECKKNRIISNLRQKYKKKKNAPESTTNETTAILDSTTTTQTITTQVALSSLDNIEAASEPTILNDDDKIVVESNEFTKSSQDDFIIPPVSQSPILLPNTTPVLTLFSSNYLNKPSHTSSWRKQLSKRPAALPNV